MSSVEQALRTALSPGYADGLECSLALYRYAARDGSSQSDKAFRTHLQTCADCRADLEQLARATVAPSQCGASPNQAAGTATERDGESCQGLQVRRAMWVRGLAASVACAGLLLFLKLHLPGHSSTRALLTPKGAAALHVAVVREGKTAQWAAVDNLLPGDELRFSYSTPSSMFPLLFAADESGTVEQIFPYGKPILAQPGNGALGAAEVDNRPGCQWLVAGFVGADESPNPDMLSAAVRKAVARRQAGSCELEAIVAPGADVHVRAKRVLLR